MNIIRTTAVELMAIPAIAYKQKLFAGGAGIKLFRLDQDASAVFRIDRRTGDAVPFGTFNVALFPDDALIEALDLTEGLPYSARGKLKIAMFTDDDTADDFAAEDVTENEQDKVDMVDSDEYQALIQRYTNEKGKINYTLMNKDFIQFASKSTTVSEMIGAKSDVESILMFIVKSRAALHAGKKDSISDEQAAALIETLDEIDPRSAFKELSAYIRRLLAKK